MDVDTVIAEAVNAEQQAEQATPPQEEQVTETEQDASSKPDSELTPEQLAKRERNRESHLKSKLARVTRENRELAAKLSQQQQPTQKATDKPDLNTFKGTWEEYNEAVTDWKLENKFSENTKKQQETQQRQEYTKWVDERSSKVDERLPELSATIPDIGDVMEEVEGLASMLSPEQARIALEAEDINLAIYTLHKEGKLEDVIKLPPSQLAAAIAKAEIRGQQYLSPSKPVSKAPAPMNAVKGTGSPGKSIDSMSVDELMKWRAKK